MSSGTTAASVNGASGRGTERRSPAGPPHAWNRLLFLLSLIFICLPVHADWTIMVYMDGDNNLESAGIDDFLEIATVGSDAHADVDIVVLFDRIDGFDVTYSDWTGARFGLINNGDTPTTAWGTDWGPVGMGYLSEPNMAAPQTVVDFVTEAVALAPSDNYALVLWNHGGGWRDGQVGRQKDGPVKAVCWDDTDGDGSGLEVNELQTALTAIVPAVAASINLIGFDACLMGMLEVAYEVRTFGEVMVGSEETEPGDGWPYDTILTELVALPTMNAAALGTVIVDEYYASYGNSEVQTAINLTEMVNVAADVDTLATLLIADHTDEAPIKVAAADVEAAVTAAVINEQHGAAWPGTHGLSIYFPSAVGSYDADYATVIDFSAATQWEEFLADYYAAMSGTWVETARGGSQYYDDLTFIDLYDFCARLDYTYITTASPLPDGDVGTPYSQVIAAAGGIAPYVQWSVPDYGESNPGAGWAGGGVAQGWQGDETCWLYALPFTFNYYGTNYSLVYVCDNGYLDFINATPDWSPSTADFSNNVRIAPMWEDFVTDGGGGQDIYITEGAGQVTIRWQGETFWTSDPVNVEVVLYQTGDVKFNYGAAHSFSWPPMIGVSSGDGVRYTFSARNGTAAIPANVSSLFEASALPPGLSIDAGTGEISGSPTAKGVYNFFVSVADSDPHPQVCSKAFAMNVTGLPVAEFDAAATSGAESTSPANLVVSLDEAGAGLITVDYNVTGGTATGGGVDYTLAAGTLMFVPLDLTESISIPIVDDATAEVNETIQVTISNPLGGATLGTTRVHTYTIVDNDAVIVPIVTSKSSIIVPEGKTASFGVSLASDPVVSVTVGVAKTAGEDTIDVAEGSALVFDASNWNTRQTVTLSASEDEDMEENSATITCSGTNLISATVTATKYDNDRMRPVGGGGGGGGCFISAAGQHQ